jgi:cell division protein FtsI (penicillin-binding protein 3)
MPCPYRTSTLNPRTSILTRLYVVLTLLCLLPVAIAAQLVLIYVGEGPELRAQGERQASSFVTIPAVRGAILDRAGRTLAVNTARYEVALDPTAPGFDARAEEFYTSFGRLTGMGASSVRRQVKNRASRQYVLLHRSLGEAAKEQLETWDVPGLILTPRFARRYTYDRIGAHVLGHVDTDLRGTAGLELQYDDVLRGQEGRQAVQRDRRGFIKTLVGGSIVEPEHGQQLVLTLDLVLQSILQEELVRGVDEADATWGTAIAMDPKTGAVLAMANAPDYDPNRASAFSEFARRNHAIADHIEPGSTFKLVTAIAALESGVVAPEDSIETGDGWAVFGGRTMKDSHAYGTITFAEAIAKSSNVALAKTAERLDAGTFYQYARNLGFGQPTLVDLPGEVGGTLRKPDMWSGTTKTSMGIGYAVNVTPLQMLTAYCALANGGLLVHPYLVAERRSVAGRTLWQAPQDSIRRAFRPETAETLRPLFERVVAEGGTAPRAAVDGLRIAGKTGTARLATQGGYTSVYRATFVGMFPADDPEVVLLVLMHHPKNGHYGGTVSAPVFARVAERWTGVMPALAGTRPAAGDLPARTIAEVPDLTNLPQAVAAREARALGFPVATDGDGWRRVAVQHPSAGTPLALRRTVRLAADSDVSEFPTVQGQMPDLRGRSARQAVAWLAALGVPATISGSGTVTDQSPAPGSSLPDAAHLTCE